MIQRNFCIIIRYECKRSDHYETGFGRQCANSKWCLRSIASCFSEDTRSVFRSRVTDFCTVMSKFRSNELVFFLVFRLKAKNVSVYFVMSKIPVFTTAHISELICRCRTAFFFPSISRSVQHDAMTQILPQYTSATLQIYYCRLLCQLRVTKKGHSRQLSIPIYCTTKDDERKEKKHYHETNIVIREMIFFLLPRPSHFPGMNKVSCYCGFDSISSRTDGF